MPFDSPLSARIFTHRKNANVQKSGAGPDFCENIFCFRPNAKFRCAEFWPDLKDKPLFTFLWKARQRFSPLKSLMNKVKGKTVMERQ